MIVERSIVYCCELTVKDTLEMLKVTWVTDPICDKDISTRSDDKILMDCQ